MLAKTHMSFALDIVLLPLCLAKVLGVAMDEELVLVFLALVCLGALAPDIDEPNSTIGKKFSFVSNFTKMIFGHRGVTHYLIIPLLFLLFFVLFLPTGDVLRYGGAGFIIGYALHIAGDALTKSGIKNGFYPLYKNKTFALLPHKFRFVTGSIFETAVLFPALTLLLLAGSYILFGEELDLGDILKELRVMGIF